METQFEVAVVELLVELRGVCDGALPSVERERHLAKLTFPPAPGAEYAFVAYVYGDGNALEVGARPLEGPTEVLFWCRTFELTDYSSFQEMLGHFKRDLLAVLTNDTVIVQFKGLFFWSFECEVLSGSETILIPGHSTLRPARAPSCRGRRRTYRGPALCRRPDRRLDG